MKPISILVVLLILIVATSLFVIVFKLLPQEQEKENKIRKKRKRQLYKKRPVRKMSPQICIGKECIDRGSYNSKFDAGNIVVSATRNMIFPFYGEASMFKNNIFPLAFFAQKGVKPRIINDTHVPFIIPNSDNGIKSTHVIISKPYMADTGIIVPTHIYSHTGEVIKIRNITNINCDPMDHKKLFYLQPKIFNDTEKRLQVYYGERSPTLLLELERPCSVGSVAYDIRATMFTSHHDTRSLMSTLSFYMVGTSITPARFMNGKLIPIETKTIKSPSCLGNGSKLMDIIMFRLVQNIKTNNLLLKDSVTELGPAAIVNCALKQKTTRVIPATLDNNFIIGSSAVVDTKNKKDFKVQRGDSTLKFNVKGASKVVVFDKMALNGERALTYMQLTCISEKGKTLKCNGSVFGIIRREDGYTIETCTLPIREHISYSNLVSDLMESHTVHVSLLSENFVELCSFPLKKDEIVSVITV